VAVDAHPLVREWFGERLKNTNAAAWRAAHWRLYEHLRDATSEGEKPTLSDLAPLYHAIAHGCRAERHEEALQKVYIARICRLTSDGSLEDYSGGKLGASSSDLAAVSWFFQKPFEVPTPTLSDHWKIWVIAEASYNLRSQGRFDEANSAMREALRRAEEEGQGGAASALASNLSETELLVGKVKVAAAMAEQAIAYADLSDDVRESVGAVVTHANSLHAAGQNALAEHLFKEAESTQHRLQPKYPLLYSYRGYSYCDFLLSQRQYALAYDRASRILEISRRQNWLLDIALDVLILGRAKLGMALQNQRDEPTATDSELDLSATVWPAEAVDGLRACEQSAHLPRGLLGRAVFCRSIGEWDGAARDLDEVEEIAELGPMRLFLCDMNLERARLAFANIEGFAPLNGVIENGPPTPVPPNPEKSAALKEGARKNLEAARKLIAECGYHRRDEELVELDAVLNGEKKFSELPPRV
jgi:tetratricopeptide (TPR) repeat protein